MAKSFPPSAIAMFLFFAVVAASLGPSAAAVAISDEEPFVVADAPRSAGVFSVSGLGALASTAFTPVPGEDPATNGCLKLLYWTHYCVMESNGKPLSVDCCREIVPDEAQIRWCFHEIYDVEPEELRYFLKLLDSCHRGAAVPRRVMPGGAS